MHNVTSIVQELFLEGAVLDLACHLVAHAVYDALTTGLQYVLSMLYTFLLSMHSSGDHSSNAQFNSCYGNTQWDNILCKHHQCKYQHFRCTKLYHCIHSMA